MDGDQVDQLDIINLILSTFSDQFGHVKLIWFDLHKLINLTCSNWLDQHDFHQLDLDRFDLLNLIDQLDINNLIQPIHIWEIDKINKYNILNLFLLIKAN